MQLLFTNFLCAPLKYILKKWLSVGVHSPSIGSGFYLTSCSFGFLSFVLLWKYSPELFFFQEKCKSICYLPVLHFGYPMGLWGALHGEQRRLHLQMDRVHREGARTSTRLGKTSSSYTGLQLYWSPVSSYTGLIIPIPETLPACWLWWGSTSQHFTGGATTVL